MFIEALLFYSAIFVLVASVILSVKTRFIQFRALGYMAKSLYNSLFLQGEQEKSSHTVLPHKALFTAMSTTLGISTMISPVIAISLGGPGALIGYLLTTIFGSAATYTEVKLAIKHRQKLNDGRIMGGPMQYLEKQISPLLARWYAFFCLLLMAAWSGAQSNQLAAIFSSPLLGSYRVSPALVGLTLALFVILILAGGIKRIADFSSKLVPIMFTLYIGASLFIVLANIDKIPALCSLVLDSLFKPYQVATGALVGGALQALRWGVFKGMHSNEAALGTQTIPQSMTDAIAEEQGVLSMLSTYSAGFVAILSGFVALITNTWQNPEYGLGINMVAASYELYFSSFGVAIIALCAALFGIGTALGNGYNGGHCFAYLTKNRFSSFYIALSAIIIFLGAIVDVQVFWGWSDVIIALVAVPHAFSLVWIAMRKEESELLVCK